MPPFIHHLIDLQRLLALWPLRNADQRAALVHFVNDPIGIKSLVRKKGVELQPPDQRLNPDCVVTVSRQKHEADQVTKCVGERQNFGGPAAFGLAYSLMLSPPFAPCAER